MLYIAAAHLAGREERFNSLTIFAAQSDFTEAGEIRALLGESMFAQLEALMHKRGVLEAQQMGSAFAALRSGDLIWGPLVDRYFLGTVTDHVAPWKSVYKIHRLNGGDVTFALTTGGHNAGIVSGPVHPRRKHQVHTRRRGDHYMDPETWQATVPVENGSWWPVWVDWLKARSSGQTNPPALGAPRKGYRPLRDAPGEYILER